jgi:Na+/melibiose symporter-like transporter
MAFGLIAPDIILRLVLIEKKIARQWLVDETTDSEGTQDTSPHREPVSHEAEKPRFPESIIPESTPASPAEHSPQLQVKQDKYPPIVTLLGSRRLLAALWGSVVQSSLLTAFDSVIPLFVQRIFHWNSTGAGLVFLAIMVPSFIAPLIGWASDNYGPRWIAVAGFTFAIPFWVLLRLVTHDSMGQKVPFCALLVLIGVSLTLVMPPLMAEITYIVEAKEKQSPGRFGPSGAYAQAYGLFITAFVAGTLIGPIWGGYVEDAAGWGTMAWSSGLFSLVGAIPCAIWTGGYIMEVNTKTGEERAIGKLPATSPKAAGEVSPV